LVGIIKLGMGDFGRAGREECLVQLSDKKALGKSASQQGMEFYEPLSGPDAYGARSWPCPRVGEATRSVQRGQRRLLFVSANSPGNQDGSKIILIVAAANWKGLKGKTLPYP